MARCLSEWHALPADSLILALVNPVPLPAIALKIDGMRRHETDPSSVPYAVDSSRSTT